MMGENKETAGRAGTLPAGIRALALSAAPEPGRLRFSVAAQPEFRLGVQYMLCYSLALAAMSYLNVAGHVSKDMKTLYIFIQFTALLGGGLRIAGKLTRRRMMLVVLNAAAMQVVDFFFSDVVAMGPVVFASASWLVLWWAFREPDILSEMGLRGGRAAVDLLKAAALSAAVFVYGLAAFKAYGFKFDYNITDAATSLAHLPVNLLTYMFLFTVWNRLHVKGMSQIQEIFVVAALLGLLYLPTMLAFWAAGAVGVGKMFAGFATNLSVFLLITLLTFRSMRNPLPAGLLQTAVMIIISWAGII